MGSCIGGPDRGIGELNWRIVGCQGGICGSIGAFSLPPVNIPVCGGVVEIYQPHCGESPQRTPPSPCCVLNGSDNKSAFGELMESIMELIVDR